jgi:hypothetical protein
MHIHGERKQCVLALRQFGHTIRADNSGIQFGQTIRAYNSGIQFGQTIRAFCMNWMTLAEWINAICTLIRHEDISQPHISREHAHTQTKTYVSLSVTCLPVYMNMFFRVCEYGSMCAHINKLEKHAHITLSYLLYMMITMTIKMHR